jgi:hypothetical protein
MPKLKIGCSQSSQEKRSRKNDMNKLASSLAVLSWFTGGILLGLIEIVTLPKDPTYSTLLQLLPLLFLAGGIWFIFSEYQTIGERTDRIASRLRMVMTIGWFAFFGIDAGVASINNISTQVFHVQLPYYYQGVSLAQKIIALAGIFVLGGTPILAWRRLPSRKNLAPPIYRDFWEWPVTSLGFVALILGVVLGLAQYWYPIVFAGFILLVAGAMLLLVGTLTEKSSSSPGKNQP